MDPNRIRSVRRGGGRARELARRRGVMWWCCAAGLAVAASSAEAQQVSDRSAPASALLKRASVAVRPAAAPAAPSRFDLNGDGKVDQADVLILMALMNAANPPPADTAVLRQQADFNNDGAITSADLTLLLGQVGNTGAAPVTAAASPTAAAGGVAGVTSSLVAGQPGMISNPQMILPPSPGGPQNPAGLQPISGPVQRSLAGPATVEPPPAPPPQPAPPASSGGGSGAGSGSGSAAGSGSSGGGGGSAAPSAPAVLGPILVPGAGFNGPPEAPQPLASGPGADAKAIARWDVVPFQAFSGEFYAGVVAFHVNGIDRVEFSLNGGPWAPVRQMRLNPQTNVWEYFATLRASDFPSAGPVEVRAVAYPVNGLPRALDGVRLYANLNNALAQNQRYVSVSGSDSNDGTLQRPFRTLYKAMQSLSAAGGASGADNGVVYCMPGEYEWKRPDGSSTPVTRNAWATIQPAPGATTDQVTIVTAAGGAGQANGGMYTKLVRLRNVTLKGTLDTIGPFEDYLWLDGIKHVGAGMHDTTIYFNSAWWSGIYATDSLSTNVVNAYLTVNLIRNCVVDTVYDFSFMGCQMVINSRVRNANGGTSPEGWTYHSDVWKDYNPGTSDNIILYGIDATENCNQQGVFSRTDSHRNFAIVNCAFNLVGYPNQSQWRTRSDHMVIMNNTFLGAPFSLGLSDTDASVSGFLGSTNVIFKNNVFQWVNLDDPMKRTGPNYPTYDSIRNSATFTNNHFVNRWPASAGASAGQAIWCAQPLGEQATTGVAVRPGIGAFGAATPPWVSAN